MGVIGLEGGQVKTILFGKISFRCKLNALGFIATSWWSKRTFRYAYLVTTYLVFGSIKVLFISTGGLRRG